MAIAAVDRPDQDDPAVRNAQETRLRAVWAPPKGLFLRWTDTNNDAIGVWYTLTAFAMMLFAGVLALVMRAQLAVPDNDLVSASTFNQLFTLHGSMMMFLFAVPMFEAVSILILPSLLGARDLPFPRLSAFGYWSFLIGGVFVGGSIFFDAAPDGGWFMYPPLATEPSLSGIGADIWMLGLSFIEVSSIAAAVELIVGVLKCRPPGMRLNLMPLYAWYVLVVAVMILFAFPPLIAGDMLFEMERLLDWPFFDATRGGDPLLWQHLFWIFGHPEVYIIFLPSIAIFAMVVPTFSRRHLLGYPWIVLAAVGTGFLSFGLWVHHMFATGLPSISLGFFSAASEAVAIPTSRANLRVDCNGVVRQPRPIDADALRRGCARDLRDRRVDRRDGGQRAVRLAGARYLFHRRAPALRTDRRLGDAALRRALLLLAARHRQEVVRSTRPHRVLADVRRLQRGLFPDAHLGPDGHAAPRLHVPAGARHRHVEPVVDHRRVPVRDRRGRRGDRSLSLATTHARGAQSVECRHARMARAPEAAGNMGRALRAADRKPLSQSGTSRTSSGTSTKDAISCPTPKKASAS